MTIETANEIEVDRVRDERDDGGKQHVRLRIRWVLFLAIVPLGLGVLLYATARPENQPKPSGSESSATVAPATDLVAKFKGEGTEATKAFQVDRRWQVSWENTGAKFRFAIVGDHDFGTVVAQRGPGSGSTVSVAPGSFQLQIKALGRWSVRVTQVSSP